jgi:probable F420-dependent oxidoreductase
MHIGKWGVFSFTDAMSGVELGPFARRVEQLGYGTLWYPEALGYETFAIGGFLLSETRRLVVASGIANIYARDPTTAVMGHNTLNTLYGGRFVLGLGVSHAPLVAGVRGHDYGRPVATMRAYLDAMDRAFGTKPAAERHVVLAALGPRMTELAAGRTLGASPYNVTPAQVGLSRAAMGGRGVLVCEQKVCLCTDPVVARRTARAALKLYLGLPNYFQNWLRLGFTPEDWAGEGSDRLMDAMVYWGSADEIRTKLRAYTDAGADQLVIQALRPDGAPGPDYAALEALAPGA